ncbi:hypothetical protein MNV49_002669 [Pseudohyphozyma bogoriensis]|nr:hypothetical protein MNV49_002669 [Pseudohyphozyma bogoriensis]
MRVFSTASVLSLLVVALVPGAQAASQANAVEATAIASAASTLHGDGTYLFTNLATNQTLSFTRSTTLTNLYPIKNGSALQVQFSGNQARLSGGNGKCVSAQWQSTVGRGYDNAAVSYACAVGSGNLTGSATLEKTKQWWYILPSDAVLTTTANAELVSVLATQAAGKHNASTTAGIGSTVSHIVARHTGAIRVPDTCSQEGAWLASHPTYVLAHAECTNTLNAYIATHPSRLLKRLHAELARTLRRRVEERAQAQTFFIIAVDHILDQETRAIGSASLKTPGGYTSTVLNPWDKSDASQMWKITSA